jgi:vacuolar-type H+-ATPase subunit I/STV1
LRCCGVKYLHKCKKGVILVSNSVDWKAIKAEYIAGGIGYKKLADKYGVSFSTLSHLAKREKWTDLKQKACEKEDMDLAKSIGKRNAKKSAKIDALADRLLDKIGELMDALIVEGKDVKSIASALRDIKEIKGIKDKLDVKEQKARIKKLEKEAAEEKEDKSIVIELGNNLEEYSK